MIFLGDKKVFIHIPKTGGSSIELQLLKKIGIKSSGNSVWGGMSHENKITFLGEKYKSFVYAPHAKAYELKQQYPELYQEYESSVIVRDPYDRFCSMYFWHTKKKGNPDPLDVHKKLIENKELMVEPQYDYIYENNICIVDRIFKFEEIDKIFEYFNVQPNHAKNMKRQKTEDFYKQWPKMKQFVANYYSKDFEVFNYEK